MSKTQSAPPEIKVDDGPAEETPKSPHTSEAPVHGLEDPVPQDIAGEAPREQSVGSRYDGTNGVEEQGQGQLEAEDFYSENHFVDEPDERNLK